jgi:hypothetical protein
MNADDCSVRDTCCDGEPLASDRVSKTTIVRTATFLLVFCEDPKVFDLEFLSVPFRLPVRGVGQELLEALGPNWLRLDFRHV